MRGGPGGVIWFGHCKRERHMKISTVKYVRAWWMNMLIISSRQPGGAILTITQGEQHSPNYSTITSNNPSGLSPRRPAGTV